MSVGPGYKIGHDNREGVRAWFLAHVGCTNVECAQALGLSVMAVGRHIKTLRREWQDGQEAVHLIKTRDVDGRTIRTFCGIGAGEPFDGEWIKDTGGTVRATALTAGATCRKCLKHHEEQRP